MFILKLKTYCFYSLHCVFSNNVLSCFVLYNMSSSSTLESYVFLSLIMEIISMASLMFLNGLEWQTKNITLEKSKSLKCQIKHT